VNLHGEEFVPPHLFLSLLKSNSKDKSMAWTHGKVWISSFNDAEILQFVKDHARANYNEKGMAWDYIVEGAYDDEEILQVARGARTLNGALLRVHNVMRTLGSHREDIQATAF
jgi:hypothetical protein